MPVPPSLEQLVRDCRAGDPSACAGIARRRGASSATELVQIVFPDRPPAPWEADAVLDGWALACELRRARGTRAPA